MNLIIFSAFFRCGVSTRVMCLEISIQGGSQGSARGVIKFGTYTSPPLPLLCASAPYKAPLICPWYLSKIVIDFVFMVF